MASLRRTFKCGDLIFIILLKDFKIFLKRVDVAKQRNKREETGHKDTPVVWF